MNMIQEMMDDVVEIGVLFADLKNTFLRKEMFDELEKVKKIEKTFYQMVYPV